MNRRGTFPALFVALLMAGTAADGQVAGVDQRELARRVAEGSRSDQAAAVDIIRQIPPESVGADLRTALVRALEIEGNRAARWLRGESPPLSDPELVPALAQLVAAFRDPAAIPALAGALGTSPPAMHALAEFGEPAGLSAVKIVEKSSYYHDKAVEHDGLVTLRFLVEGVGGPPLTPDTRARVRQIALERLTTPQRSVVTVWLAIDLAMALGDAELRSIVRQLASSSSAVEGLGIVDLDLIERTQRQAAERIAGVAARPRHERSEEFAKRWK